MARSPHWLGAYGAASAAALVVLASVLAPAAAARRGDRDHDGLPDRWERHFRLSTSKRTAAGDPDRDRLSNRTEYRLHLNPRRRDTDRDRLSDGFEVQRVGTNPRRRDTDRDRLADDRELGWGTNPRRRDTDGDGVSDGDEVRRGTDPLHRPAREPEGRPPLPSLPHPHPPPPKPPTAPPLPPLPGAPKAYVDVESRGGACSDARSASEASSPATPWCSVARAVGAAPANGLVLVRGGDYPSFSINAPRSSPVTLRPYSGEVASLRGGTLSSGAVRFEGFYIRGTVTVRYPAKSLAFVGNDWITDGRSGGTSVNLETGVEGVLVENNRIGQAPGILGANAINFSSTDARLPIVDVTIRGNRIGPVAGGGDAIQAKHTKRLLIEENEIFGVARPNGTAYHPDAIQSIFGFENLTIRRNFIHDIASQGVAIQLYRGANTGLTAEHNVVARVASPWTAFSFEVAGAEVRHNTVNGRMLVAGSSIDLVANIATYALAPDPGTRFTRNDYNLSSRFTTAPGPNSIVGTPTYQNAAGNDFTLTDSSPGHWAAADRSDVGSHSTVFPSG